MFLKRVLNGVEWAIKIICGVLLAIIVIDVTYAVIMRYIFHNPPAWSMELGTFLYIWLVMLGAVLVTRDKSHIDITVIVDYFPHKMRFAWYIFLRLLMIGFCGLMVQQGIRIYGKVSEASSPSFGISMGWLYSSVPVAGFLMGIYFIEQIIKSFTDGGKIHPAQGGSE